MIQLAVGAISRQGPDVVDAMGEAVEADGIRGAPGAGGEGHAHGEAQENGYDKPFPRLHQAIGRETGGGSAIGNGCHSMIR